MLQCLLDYTYVVTLLNAWFLLTVIVIVSDSNVTVHFRNVHSLPVKRYLRQTHKWRLTAYRFAGITFNS